MGHLKLVVMGCLHGRLGRDVLQTIKSEKPDAVLISGDFSGGDYSEELRKYESYLVENFGPMQELWPMEVQIESDRKFRKWSRISDRNVKKIFDSLEKLGLPVFYIHGNWDPVSAEKGFMENIGDSFIDRYSTGNVKFIHGKVVRIKDFSVAGFGGYRGTSRKEYLCKNVPGFRREMEYILQVRDNMKMKMEKLFLKVKDKRKMILLTHDPPYRTFDFLDTVGKFYGEKVTKDLIKKYNPLVCLCSHFHEHRGTKNVGKSLVVATGFGYDGQIAVLDIEDGKVDVRLLGK